MLTLTLPYLFYKLVYLFGVYQNRVSVSRPYPLPLFKEKSIRPHKPYAGLGHILYVTTKHSQRSIGVCTPPPPHPPPPHTHTHTHISIFYSEIGLRQVVEAFNKRFVLTSIIERQAQAYIGDIIMQNENSYEHSIVNTVVIGINTGACWVCLTVSLASKLYFPRIVI